jgi:hypothetical protein
MAGILGPDGSQLVVDPSGAGVVQRRGADICVSAVSLANTALTATLPAAGTGLFHHITRIEITRVATAALAGNAALTATTTNLPGSLAWSFGNAMTAGGQSKDVDADFTAPLKSSVANTATTIVLPAAGAAVIWRVNVFYYTSKN